MEVEENVSTGPTVTYMYGQVTEIPPVSELEETEPCSIGYAQYEYMGHVNIQFEPGTSETDRNYAIADSRVTYRQNSEIQEGPEFESSRLSANSRQSGQYDYIDHVNIAEAAPATISIEQPRELEVENPENPEYEDTIIENEYDYIDERPDTIDFGRYMNRQNSEQSRSQVDPQFDPQHEYNYINETFDRLATIDFGRYINRQTHKIDSGSLRKYKIAIVTVVILLSIFVIVGIVLGLILQTRFSTEDIAGNEAIQTIAGSTIEKSTTHDGISLTGEGTEDTLDDEQYKTSAAPKSEQTTENTSENEFNQTTTSPLDGQTTIDFESSHKDQGLLVIIGGQTSITQIYYNTVQIYTLGGGNVTWKKYGRSAPYRWTNGGTATSGGNIYIAGGGARDRDGRSVELYHRRAAKYNVRDDRWEILPNKTMGSPNGPAMYVIDNHLYASSTFNLFTATEKLELPDVNSGWRREEVESIHDVNYIQVVVIGNTTYICAGNWPGSKRVISWTYGEQAWTPVANMNIARYNSHGTVTDGVSNIWVVGGCDPDDCWPDGFIEHYNVIANTWTKLTHVPKFERDEYTVQVCSFLQGYIYVIFSSYNRGYWQVTRFHVYNTQTGEWHEDRTELMLIVKGSMSAIVSGTP